MTKSSVLITGAGGGLGKALTAECASRGWDLFLTDVSDDVLAPLAAGMARMYGVRVQYRAADLTDPAAREALWHHIDQQHLCFHMLLNVAGIDYEGPFHERHVDEVRTILRLNVESTVEMTRRCITRRDPSQTLRIVTVSSLAAFYPMPIKAVYASSKRFLLDWSLALHEELRDEDTTVTVVCPAGMPSNPGVIRHIAAQGFMGQITTMNVGFVAARTIDQALDGQRLYIPGIVNRILRLLGELVPAPMIAHVLNKRWQMCHQRGQMCHSRAPGSPVSMLKESSPGAV
jgi:short-subunit dehydrogenase